MGNRLGLLIGVAEYDQPGIPDLPIVHNDIRDLASVLERSHYSVREIGTGGSHPATRNNTRGAIEDALSEAEPGDTLLIYFSGHGAHYDGKDWLVPSDGRITGPKFHEYLVHLDFASFVENSQAGTVLFFIDACREGVELGEVGALAGLLLFDGFDDGGEAVLEVEGGLREPELPDSRCAQIEVAGGRSRLSSNFVPIRRELDMVL